MDSTRISEVSKESPEKFLNALAENYLLQDAILNATELAIISTRPDGTITSINKAGEPMLGYSSLDLIGEKKLSIFSDVSELRECKRELIKSGIEISSDDEVLMARAKLKIPDHREWTFVRKDGSRFPVSLSITGIWNEHGQLMGYLAIATDITEQKQAEAARAVAARELRTQNQQLNEFAHIISHNLRSPVGNIGALISLLGDKSSLADYQMIFDKLRIASGNLNETLNELMEILMIKDENTAERTTLRFEDIFKKVKQGFSGEIIKTGAIVTFDFSSCPEIQYSKTYLESIMLNLLSNALKYRSPQRVLNVRFETFCDDNNPVLKVSDNAQGIDLVKNGTKLFNLRKTFHEHKDARGVGLFLTRTQIEAMGGTISAESQVGVGTTFTVQFQAGNAKSNF